MQAVHFAQNWMLTLSFIDLTYRCHRVVTVGLCVFQKSTFCLKDIQVRAVWQFGGGHCCAGHVLSLWAEGSFASAVTQPAYLTMAGFHFSMRSGYLGSRVPDAEQAGDGVLFVLFVAPIYSHVWGGKILNLLTETKFSLGFRYPTVSFLVSSQNSALSRKSKWLILQKTYPLNSGWHLELLYR